MEDRLRLDERPPLDLEERAILRERILPGDLDLTTYARGAYPAHHSWVGEHFSYEIIREDGAIELAIHSVTPVSLTKHLRFDREGRLAVRYAWNPGTAGQGDKFAAELSLFRPLPVSATPMAEIWTYSVDTVAKSERGLDRTRQGESVTVRWPVELGSAELRLEPAAGS